MLHIYPCEQADYSVISEWEKEILEKVIEKFKSFKAKEIVDNMHEEKAYKETDAGSVIPFCLAQEIREF